MIRSFRSRDTQALFHDREVRLEDLSAVPGNRLESLKGERRGQLSIRINRQWRLCFVWRNGDAFDVEIVDYH